MIDFCGGVSSASFFLVLVTVRSSDVFFVTVCSAGVFPAAANGTRGLLAMGEVGRRLPAAGALPPPHPRPRRPRRLSHWRWRWRWRREGLPLTTRGVASAPRGPRARPSSPPPSHRRSSPPPRLFPAPSPSPSSPLWGNSPLLIPCTQWSHSAGMIPPRTRLGSRRPLVREPVVYGGLAGGGRRPPLHPRARRVVHRSLRASAVPPPGLGVTLAVSPAAAAVEGGRGAQR